MSVSMKFCPECRNLLYPREDKKNKILLSACRTCSYTEMAESNCVYRHVITDPDARPCILRDAYADPTLRREKGVRCPVCNHPNVAFFLINPRKSLARKNVCCNRSCRHKWIDEDSNII